MNLVLLVALYVFIALAVCGLFILRAPLMDFPDADEEMK